MEKMTKKAKFKKFVNENEDLLIAGAYLTGALAAAGTLFGLAVKIVNDDIKATEAAVKSHNEWAERENKFLDEQRELGKDVYLLHDFSYLFIPTDSPRENVKVGK